MLGGLKILDTNLISFILSTSSLAKAEKVRLKLLTPLLVAPTLDPWRKAYFVMSVLVSTWYRSNSFREKNPNLSVFSSIAGEAVNRYPLYLTIVTMRLFIFLYKSKKNWLSYSRFSFFFGLLFIYISIYRMHKTYLSTIYSIISKVLKVLHFTKKSVYCTTQIDLNLFLFGEKEALGLLFLFL